MLKNNSELTEEEKKEMEKIIEVKVAMYNNNYFIISYMRLIHKAMEL